MRVTLLAALLAVPATANDSALARIEAGGDVLAEVLRAEAAVREAEEAVRRENEEALRIASDLARARAAEEAARAAVDQARARIGPRLRARYRALRAGSFAAGGEASVAVRTGHALDTILAADLALLREAKQAGDRLAVARAALEDLESAARLGGTEQARTRARSAADVEARDALARAIRERPALRQRVVTELARQEKKLGEQVRDLPATPPTGIVARKGSLRSPCPGAIVEVPYGKVINPKFNTVTFQQGWDLRVPAGAPVIAPAAGQVAHAAWFGGYGNLLILDHGAGVHTLYAHLQDFARGVGDEIQEGEVLGRVGDTGSLKGAYLYFELRKDGKAMDPAAWIGRR